MKKEWAGVLLCPNCDKGTKPDDKFCSGCGEKLVPVEKVRGPYGTNDDDVTIVDRSHPDFHLMYSDFGPK